MKFIDKDELLDALEDYKDEFSDDFNARARDALCRSVIATMEDIVNEQPVVNPAKHGHWILDETIKNPRYQIKTCSLCGCRVNGSSFNYCPNCGAKMLQVEG